MKSKAANDTPAVEQDSWAVVEVMGHNVFAGKISEHVIGGTGFIRVDVPALPKRKTKRYGYKETSPAVPAFTKLIGAGSIYAITPCTEEAARKVAKQKRSIPMNVLDLEPTAKRLAASSEDADDD